MHLHDFSMRDFVVLNEERPVPWYGFALSIAGMDSFPVLPCLREQERMQFVGRAAVPFIALVGRGLP